MIWERINDRVLRSGEWSIIKHPWGSYCLWYGDEFKGRFNSAMEAKQHATGSGKDSSNNPPALAGQTEEGEAA